MHERLHYSSQSGLLRIVDNGVHAGMAGGFLHLLEYPFLLVELLLDLRRALQLLRLITAGWALVLDAAVGGLNRRLDLVDPRLECGHFIFLRDDLSLPLLGGALLG